MVNKPLRITAAVTDHLSARTLCKHYKLQDRANHLLQANGTHPLHQQSSTGTVHIIYTPSGSAYTVLAIYLMESSYYGSLKQSTHTTLSVHFYQNKSTQRKY